MGLVQSKMGVTLDVPQEFFKLALSMISNRENDCPQEALVASAILNNLGHICSFKHAIQPNSLKVFSRSSQLAKKAHTLQILVGNDKVSSEDASVQVIHRHLASILLNEGYVSHKLGDSERALECFREAIVYAKTESMQHDIIFGMKSIGEDYQNQRCMYDEAMNVYLDVIESCKTLLMVGENSKLFPVLAVIWYNVGKIQYEKENLHFALNAFNSSLKLRKQELGEHHPDVASIMHDIGTLQIEIGQLSESLISILKAHNIRRSFFGRNHKDVAVSLFYLGMVLQKLGRYEEALKVYLETVRIEKLVLGDFHPDVAITLCNIGEIHHANGGLELALNRYEQALNILRKSMGHSHHSVARVLRTVGFIHVDRGEYKGALSAFTECSRIIELLTVRCELPEGFDVLCDIYNDMLSIENSYPDSAVAA